MNFRKTVKAAIVICYLFMLTGCTFKQKEDPVTSVATTREQGDTIMEAVLSEDAETIAELFCPYVKENHPNLESEIEGLFAFIDGDIISYDESWVSVGKERSTTEDGPIPIRDLPALLSAKIKNIYTSTGKVYKIVIATYSTRVKHPEYAGVREIIVSDEELYTQENGYPEEGKYKIY